MSNPTKKLILGSQLKRARALLHFNPKEVAQELGVNQKDLSNWERDLGQPNLKQLEALAKIYGREIDYFLHTTPAPPLNIEFRGEPGNNLSSLSREARIVLARFDELCRFEVEVEKLLNEKRQVKPLTFKRSDPPEFMAQRLRNVIRASHHPLPDLRSILVEEHGFIIFELPVPDNSFSGFSFLHDDYGPCILINAKDSKGRRNFTLAHELAHLLYHEGSTLCSIPMQFNEASKTDEQKANKFAVELLLPESGIREDFKRRGISITPSDHDLILMASKWAVSIQALGFRLENLSLIQPGLVEKIKESQAKFFRRPKTPTWERQVGTRFKEISVKAYANNLISISKLAHALRIPIRKALEITENK